MPDFISTNLRREIIERANECCEYCKAQQRYSHDYFSIEHIVPKVKKGETQPENLALSCQACNNHKYVFIEAIDPLSGLVAPLFNPRLQQWDEHFIWDETYGLMVGITPTGRATIERLCLNREGLVNLRLALAGIGKHPPMK